MVNQYDAIKDEFMKPIGGEGQVLDAFVVEPHRNFATGLTEGSYVEEDMIKQV